jgi:hypothetical protein
MNFTDRKLTEKIAAEAYERGKREAEARLIPYAEARNAAIKGLLAHLPELWGDSVVDGMLTLNVDADAIHAALSNVIPTTSQEPPIYGGAFAFDHRAGTLTPVASIPTGVPEPKVDHVFPLYPDTRQEAHEIDTSSRKRLAKLAERCRTSDVRPAEVAMILESVLSAPQRWVEPEGWKLVPVEPTVVQANAGVDADDMRTGFETVKHLYRAMVKAAPPAPGCEYRTGDSNAIR